MFGARVRIVLQAELVLFDLLLLLILMVHHAISTPTSRVDGVTAGLGRATQARLVLRRATLHQVVAGVL